MILAQVEVPGGVGIAGRPPQLVSIEPVRPAAPVAAANLNISRRVSRLGGMAELTSLVTRMQIRRTKTETDKDWPAVAFVVSNYERFSESPDPFQLDITTFGTRASGGGSAGNSAWGSVWYQ